MRIALVIALLATRPALAQLNGRIASPDGVRQQPHHASLVKVDPLE